MTNQEKYKDRLEYLTRYGMEDWLGFGVITGFVGELLGPGHTMSEQRSLTLKFVSDLYDRGVVPGDLMASNDEPFAPWSGDKSTIVSRVGDALASLPELPDTGDVCWFSEAE